jgi:hypothetical protein
MDGLLAVFDRQRSLDIEFADKRRRVAKSTSASSKLAAICAAKS